MKAPLAGTKFGANPQKYQILVSAAELGQLTGYGLMYWPGGSRPQLCKFPGLAHAHTVKGETMPAGHPSSVGKSGQTQLRS
jgi:hypothetical protein